MAGTLISNYAIDGPNWTELLQSIEKARKGYIGLSLTNYDNSDEPAIEAGSFVEIVGALYGFASEEAIGGSPTTANINYIVFDPTPITFSWSIVAPTWSAAKNAWMDAGEAKRYIGGCYYVDTPTYTGKWIYRDRGIREYNIEDDAVTTPKIKDANVTLAKMAVDSVDRTKLKTDMGSIAKGPTPGSEMLVLPGGEYGFYPQTKSTNDDVDYIIHIVTTSAARLSTTYVTRIYFSIPGGGVLYAQQRYITSSGEVYWIFILRNKRTKKIISIYQAPDHPCFGNGGKPLLVSHPFDNYDKTTQEIIVINPSKKEVKEIKEKCIVNDETKPDLDFIDAMWKYYDIDEMSNPKWSITPITVGLPPNWKDLPIGSDIKPIKKIIPKPSYIKVKKLKLKK